MSRRELPVLQPAGCSHDLPNPATVPESEVWSCGLCGHWFTCAVQGFYLRPTWRRLSPWRRWRLQRRAVRGGPVTVWSSSLLFAVGMPILFTVCFVLLVVTLISVVSLFTDGDMATLRLTLGALLGSLLCGGGAIALTRWWARCLYRDEAGL